VTQSIPKQLFFTKGVGTHREQLHSFELALRDAGIEKCNLVQVSSIMPPGCRIISRMEGLKKLKPGAITFCVMSRCCSNEPRRLISASIGCAIPMDKKHMVTSVSIILSGITKSRQATMRKIWRRRCWLPRWALISTWTKAGMRRKSYLKSAGKSSGQETQHNRRF